MKEIIFLVEESPKGGYEAQASGTRYSRKQIPWTS